MKNLLPLLLSGALIVALSHGGFAAPQSDEGAPNSTEGWCLTPQFSTAFAARKVRTLAGVITAVDARKGVIKIAVDYPVSVAIPNTQSAQTGDETKTVEVALTKDTMLQKLVISSVPNKTTDKTQTSLTTKVQIEALRLAEIKVGQRASFGFVLPLSTDATLSTNAEPPQRVVASMLLVRPESLQPAAKAEAAPTK